MQIQANYLYLIAQFLNKTTNRRTDEYGGSIKNRAHFFFEILETVLEHVPANRVGVKTGPMNVDGAFVANDETLPTSEYVIGRLNDYDLSHLLLMGATTDFSCTPLAALAGDGMFRHFRALYRGPLIANTEIDRERGNRLIEEGLADMVAFGRPYIANPDLPERFARRNSNWVRPLASTKPLKLCRKTAQRASSSAAMGPHRAPSYLPRRSTISQCA